MEKGVGYQPKEIKQPNDIEFLATLHNQEKESMFLLKMLINWMGRNERNPTLHAKNMINFYRQKADELFCDKVIPNEVRFRPFKSLMEQLASGELSHKRKQ